MRKLDKREEQYMIHALELARTARDQGETPVGAVVVQDGEIVGTGYNRVEIDTDPTGHAEMIAVREAAKKTGDWRLPRATIYVTLEPCIMCVTALILARVKRLVYGARDHRWGGVGSLFDLSHDPRLNHQIEVVSGMLEKEAADLLQDFFRNLRNNVP